jgi:hypothetical protein
MISRSRILVECIALIIVARLLPAQEQSAGNPIPLRELRTDALVRIWSRQPVYVDQIGRFNMASADSLWFHTCSAIKKECVSPAISLAQLDLLLARSRGSSVGKGAAVGLIGGLIFGAITGAATCAECSGRVAYRAAAAGLGGLALGVIIGSQHHGPWRRVDLSIR